MFTFFRKRRRVPCRRYRAHLEILEDRTAPAIITLAGAGRFQDGSASSLIYTGSNHYVALNLRSAIIGADNLAGPDTIVLEDGTYTMNSGAGQFVVNDFSGTLAIQNGAGGGSTIDARGQSRAFLNQTGLTLSGLKIENGVAADRGGAIFSNAALNIVNCQFVHNEARGGMDGIPVQGGAIFSYLNGSLNVVNSTFSGNIAQGGTSSVFVGNTAAAEGGAIFISGNAGMVPNTILDSTFVSNQALGGNGTVVNGFGGRGGDAAGGGIFAEAGNEDVNVLNATFASNSAQGGKGMLDDGGSAWGGGLYFQNGGMGSFRLVNDTIAFNSAFGGQGNGALALGGTGSGGGVASSLTGPRAPRVINTVVAKNTAAANNDIAGVYASLGSNLIGTNAREAGFSNATGDFTGTATAPLDPGLDSLGYYGGPTQTFHPHAGSPLLDTGNNSVAAGAVGLSTDQRGHARKSGSAVDIGAFEVIQSGQDKSYTLAQGAVLTTTPANGLLAGYHNPLGKTVSVQVIAGQGPGTGKLTLNANGSFSYTPPKAFHGTVSFRFQIIVNGQATDICTVTITVAKTSGRLTL